MRQEYTLQGWYISTRPNARSPISAYSSIKEACGHIFQRSPHNHAIQHFFHTGAQIRGKDRRDREDDAGIDYPELAQIVRRARLALIFARFWFALLRPCIFWWGSGQFRFLVFPEPFFFLLFENQVNIFCWLKLPLFGQ